MQTVVREAMNQADDEMKRDYRHAPAFDCVLGVSHVMEVSRDRAAEPSLTVGLLPRLQQQHVDPMRVHHLFAGRPRENGKASVL